MTRRVVSSFRGAVTTFWVVTRALGGEISSHWGMAAVSLVSAGAIWFVIQDIENPRTEGVVPVDPTDQGIPVEFVNVSPDYVVAETARVRVRVEAREADIPNLNAADFRAVVDMQGVQGEVGVLRPVRVTSAEDGVTVIAVEPSQVFVQLVRVAQREFEVQVNLTGELPSGFVETEARVVEPAFVTIRGREELVANVDRIEIDVNLSGQRQDFEVTGELVARNLNGDRQQVIVIPTRATVSFTIEPAFVEKTLPVRPRATGEPAAGYQIKSISADPPTVTVRGAAADVANLTELTLEQLDITGASTPVTQTRRLTELSGVTMGRESVVVEVQIEPIQCGTSSPDAPCGATTFVVAPSFVDVPAELAVADGSYGVTVKLSGPLSAAGTLDPRSIVAIVSLAGGVAGVATYDPAVSVPAPYRVENVAPLSVELIPVTGP